LANKKQSFPVKIGWKKSKHVGLAQQNWFGLAILHSLLRLAKNRAKPLTPAREECNKYDVTIDPYCRLVKVVCLLLEFSSLPPLCSPNFTFMGGVGEK
jgi:hypothetical protein